MLNAIDYLSSLNYGKELITAISDHTGHEYTSLWISNAKANREIVKKCGWVASDLQDAHQGKTAIMLGASPAITKQFETLDGIQSDPDFILITVHSGLKILLENKIFPKYCMIADAKLEVKRFWDDLDIELTKSVTLIANVCTHPDLLKMWQGPIKFITYLSSDTKLDKKFKKWFNPINGIGEGFYSLSSQYNSGVAIAFLIFRCNPIIFVGSESSFPDKEGTYYPNRKDEKDNYERKAHLDIYGNIVYTSYGLYSSKLVLEDFLGKLSGEGWFFNCTEAGIFGVSKKHGNLPWIHQFKLKTGIAQARSIMRTGKPFYLS